MAIKILKDAGFNSERAFLAFTHKDSKITASVWIADDSKLGDFIEFTGQLPVSKALDCIRRCHNADYMNGIIGTASTLPFTPEVQEALIRQYGVTDSSYQARLGLIEYAPKTD
ncbi:hypothetical protein SEA_KEANU_89 [Streptomyces phage Keanu]|nr:hypothetical protein SEA_KEANU_89 [Streptomyces phage Keanu]